MLGDWQENGLTDSGEHKVKSEKFRAKNSKAQKKYRDKKQVKVACQKGSCLALELMQQLQPQLGHRLYLIKVE